MHALRAGGQNSARAQQTVEYVTANLRKTVSPVVKFHADPPNAKRATWYQQRMLPVS